MAQDAFQGSANPSLEARRKINDWHFDCECRMTSSFSSIVHQLWREGYPVHVPQLFAEQTKETTEVAKPVEKNQGTESDPAMAAVRAHLSQLRQTTQALNGEFSTTSLPPEDGYPHSWVKRSYEFFNIYGSGGQKDVVMQIPMLRLHQYSSQHHDTEAPYDFPKVYSSAILFGEPRGASVDILKARPDDVINRFTPEDDLYVKTAESMAGLKQQLRNIMDALAQQGLITKVEAREEPRRTGGLRISI